MEDKELGSSVGILRPLDADSVIASWPPVGGAGSVPIVNMLDERLMAAVRDPTGWWLPDDLRPHNRTRCDVMASDDVWYRLCQAAHHRGLMKIVPDGQLHKDREGHYITIGAGGISSGVVPKDGQESEQEFFPLMDAVNEHSDRLLGERDAVRFGGLLKVIVSEERGKLYMNPSQLAGALTSLSIPDSWLPHFAFSKKVCASAFGGTAEGVLVRPAWCRLPGGWHNSLVLMETAVCELVFTRCGVPRCFPQLRPEAQLRGEQPSVSCFESIEELRRLKTFAGSLESDEPSQHVRRFKAICGALRMPLKLARDLVISLTRGVDGMALDVGSGNVKVAAEEVQSFISLTLCLLQLPRWRESDLRRWLGKAVFISTFHRPLLSVLDSLFAELARGLEQEFIPRVNEMEEVICFMILSLQAESPQKVEVSHEISRTTAQPTGGSGASATAFVDRSLEVSQAAAPRDDCVTCMAGRA